MIYRILLFQLLSLTNLSAAASSLPSLASDTQRQGEVEVVELEGGEGRHKGLGPGGESKGEGWMGGNRGSKKKRGGGVHVGLLGGGEET